MTITERIAAYWRANPVYLKESINYWNKHKSKCNLILHKLECNTTNNETRFTLFSTYTIDSKSIFEALIDMSDTAVKITNRNTSEMRISLNAVEIRMETEDGGGVYITLELIPKNKKIENKEKVFIFQHIK